MVQQAVLDDLEAWGEDLGEALGPAWRALRLRLRLREGPGYFLHPLALPILQLPLWLALGPVPAPEAEVYDAAGSAAAGYLAVRIQDDLLDEGAGGSPADLMLALVLFARHHHLAARVAGPSAAFQELSEQRWRAYAEAMAQEALLSPETPITEARFQVLLQRSGPLLLPPAALLLPRAPALLPALTRLVDHLARSHQLFTDAIDAEKDLRNGNRSRVLDRMGAAEGAQVVRRRLYLEGGLDEVTAEAVALVEAARGEVRTLGLPQAEAWLDTRLATMEQVRQEAFATLFRRILADG